MKRYLISCSALLCALLSSCVTDSISGNRSPFYRGELSDYDVIGPGTEGNSDADIRSALARSAGSVRPARGSRVLLVQSGAIQPDPALSTAFSSYCECQPFSGVPESAESSGETAQRFNSQRLRMAAAKAGARSIVVVWGQLETVGSDVDGGLVGALPVVNALIPTKAAVTRLRLKALILDTASGQWTSVASEPRHADGLTTSYAEDAARTIRYEKLKAAAYPDLARQVFGA